MIGDTSEPTNGIPSLTTDEIISLYYKYLQRAPDANELATDSANALKYSAAGIERGIALRGSNTAGSGVRGDETLAPLTVPATITGNVVTMGPAATAQGSTATGPTGTLAAPLTPGLAPTYTNAAQLIGAPRTGLSLTTMLILGAMAVAAYFLLVKK